MSEFESKDFDVFDDGSSLEKRIESLNKNDPNYAQKFDLLYTRLKEFKKRLEKIDKEVSRQLAVVKRNYKELKEIYDKRPFDKDLANAVNSVALDAEFLRRAKLELFSLKGDYNNSMERVSASKEFNQPVDVKVVTEVNVKPLPSYKIEFYEQQNTKEKSRPRRDRKKTLTYGGTVRA